jgi:hypothetical protein
MFPAVRPPERCRQASMILSDDGGAREKVLMSAATGQPERDQQHRHHEEYFKPSHCVVRPSPGS